MLRSRIVLVTLLVLGCVSCGRGDVGSVPSAGPEPSIPGPTAANSPTSPTSTTASVPPELAGYSSAERVAYQDALKAYSVYNAKDATFFAKGKTTIAARDFYQRYAIDWSTAWGNLAVIANNDAVVKGTTRVVSTRPKSIQLNGADGEVIVIHRCLDESGRVVTQHGKRLGQPQLKTPHLYTIRLEMRPAEGRWRSGIAKQGATC